MNHDLRFDLQHPVLGHHKVQCLYTLLIHIYVCKLHKLPVLSVSANSFFFQYVI